jgi:hypothetical protein
MKRRCSGVAGPGVIPGAGELARKSRAAAYFEREAGQCDAVKEGAALEVLPDGVTLEAAQTAARWSAGLT